MANYFYGKALENFASGNIAYLSNDIRMILVDAAEYTDSQNVDDALDDIAAGGRVAVSGNMAGKSCTLGALDASDVVFPAVSGDQFEKIVGYKHTGTESTSWLINKYDTSVTGLPCAPNGGDITVALPNDSNKWGKL